MNERLKLDAMSVVICPDTEAMARQAAADAADAIAAVLGGKETAHVVFAGGESQMAFHRALAKRPVPWPRVHAIQVDEFYEPTIPPACAVGAQPQRDLYDAVPIGCVHRLDYAAADPQTERARFENVLRQHPPDIAFLGIGTSGHLAFNEPGQTDFNDTRDVRVIDVCEQSKRQLETDPNFCRMSQIPSRGITMTIPALMRVPRLLVIVPYALKAAVVSQLFTTEVTPAFPASILKTRADVTLYLDRDSAAHVPRADRQESVR